ncbi:hypothetical protein O181_092089 [Austropuccinia psidii MF-1]|uniref:DDE Tnp4 domain-containing protein n=1 Tax=Austropuccinia psidii MF-1 TaxID=1389203 RepID=A0A9Q3IYL3_9BASI|nr:hypothetical protein [Austropuccinia psidii MF-1]
MPKASARIPLLHQLNTMKNILVMESNIDSDMEEDVSLLQHLSTQSYIRPHKTNPLAYIHTSRDLVQLSSHKFKQLCRTTHEFFQQISTLIQDDPIFQNPSIFKQRDPAIQLALALELLGFNGNGASFGKLGMLFEVSHGAIVLYTQRIIKALIKYEKEYIMWPNSQKQLETSEVMKAKQFPGCVVSIDGSLIPLSQRPPRNGEAYFDFKKRYLCHSYYIEPFLS